MLCCVVWLEHSKSIRADAMTMITITIIRITMTVISMTMITMTLISMTMTLITSRGSCRRSSWLRAPPCGTRSPACCRPVIGPLPSRDPLPASDWSRPSPGARSWGPARPCCQSAQSPAWKYLEIMNLYLCHPLLTVFHQHIFVNIFKKSQFLSYHLKEKGILVSWLFLLLSSTISSSSSSSLSSSSSYKISFRLLRNEANRLKLGLQQKWYKI